jgi:hypothetical protein
LPEIYVVPPLDLRPAVQKTGEGKLMNLTFPADRLWPKPVADIYRDALSADVTQTNIGIVMNLESHAEYMLESEILSMTCHFKRYPSAFLLPLGVGTLGGFFLSDDASGRLKRAALLSVLAMGAVPSRAYVTAECEVRLTLRNPQGEILWQETCIGLVDETVGEAPLSRRDEMHTEAHLPTAIKRCNACLLGQLRQFMNSQYTY